MDVVEVRVMDRVRHRKVSQEVVESTNIFQIKGIILKKV